MFGRILYVLYRILVVHGTRYTGAHYQLFQLLCSYDCIIIMHNYWPIMELLCNQQCTTRPSMVKNYVFKTPLRTFVLLINITEKILYNVEMSEKCSSKSFINKSCLLIYISSVTLLVSFNKSRNKIHNQ